MRRWWSACGAGCSIPQLVNTWAIEKTEGTPWGGWHRGLNPDDYTVRRGQIRTRMLNCVYFLTDNDEDDGCLTVVPGAHKSEIDLPMAEFRGRDLPGAMRVTGKAGGYDHVLGDAAPHRRDQRVHPASARTSISITSTPPTTRRCGNCWRGIKAM